MKVHEFMHEMATTSAILGRQSGVSVVFEGEGARTDGKVIYLPSMPYDAVLTPEQVMAMRGFVDHEAGHVRHSDMPRLLDFYDKCMHNGKEGLRHLENCVEDIWMEEEVMHEYPGAYKNLRQTNILMRTRDMKAIDEYKETLKTNNWTTAAAAMMATRPTFEDCAPNQEMAKVINEVNPKIMDWGKRWNELALECKSTEDCITLAKSIYKLLEEDPNLDSMQPEEFQGNEGEGEPEGENSPGFDKDGKGKGKGQPGEGEGEGEAQGFASTDIAGALSEPGEDAAGGIGGLGEMSGSTHYKVYSTKSDKMYYPGKRTADGNSTLNGISTAVDFQDYEKTKAQLKSDILVMKTKLRRSLLAKIQRDWDFGKETGRLDTKRLVKASTGNRNVFKTRFDREDENTAITILIDLSGSMMGQKVQTAQECAIALAECFEGTQMRYRISGFSNRGDASNHSYGEGRGYHRYERLDHIVFKDFDMTSRKCRPQLGLIHKAAGGNNSDYDFVLKELMTLKDRTESRKVLFVLSDGHPACTSDYNYHDHAKHIKKAITEYSRKGIQCVGIGIMDSAVKEIYADHVVVNNVGDLSKTAFNKLNKILVGNK